MADGYFLSEADLAKIRWLIDREEKRNRRTEPRQPRDEGEPPAPETYVAKSPEGGIPALSVHGTGSSLADLSDDEPGHADCEIYRIVIEDEAATLRPIPHKTKLVFNLSLDDVPGDTWLIIGRDKFGFWFVQAVLTDSCTMLEAIPGYNAAVQQILGHDAGGICSWFDVEECDTGTGSG